MPLGESFASSATITATERSLPSDTTTGVPVSRTDSGFFRPWLDTNALAYGDEFELTLYEKILSGGTQRTIAKWTLVGGCVPPIFQIPMFGLKHGWDLTLKKIAGTDRTIEWSIRKICDLTEAFAVTETVGTTEHSFVTDTGGPDLETTDVVAQAWFDLTNLTISEEYLFQQYEKVRSAGSQRVFSSQRLIGKQTPPVLVIAANDLMHGWDYTIDKIAGTDRSIDGSIRKAA